VPGEECTVKSFICVLTDIVCSSKRGREKINAYRVLVGKPDGGRPPRKPGHSGSLILKLIWKEFSCVEWINVDRGKDVHEPSGSTKHRAVLC